MADKKRTCTSRDDLATQSVVAEEATSQVWKRFEGAMEKLDPASAEVLSEFFNGTPIAQIARTRNLGVEETRAWVDRIKREITQEIRSTIKVRQ